MRRLTRFALALAVLAALVSPVLAQPFIIGPGGIVDIRTASVSVSNTTTGTTVYSLQVPAGISTGPLHLKIYGTLSTHASCVACVSTINLGVNYGTLASASVSLVNGVAQVNGLSSIPVQIDVFVRPTTLATTAPYIQAWYATFTTTNLAVNPLVATSQAIAVDPSGSPTLTVTWQWSSAAATNVFRMLSATLTIE